VLENSALTDKGKKALLAVLRMEQLAEEGKAHGQAVKPCRTGFRLQILG